MASRVTLAWEGSANVCRFGTPTATRSTFSYAFETKPLLYKSNFARMGITYTNECFAKCEGVKNPTKGKCAKQNPFVKRSIPMPEENAETAEQIEALKNELGLDKESLARMEDLFLPEDGDADDDDNLEGYME